MNPRPAAILAAARHAVKNEWREVAIVDQQLAQVPWTDVWFSEALELRVNWRLRVTDAAEAKRFADEAITMLDRVAVMSPTISIFGLRTRAGVIAGRNDVVIESLSNYARLATGLVRAGVSTPESLREDAKALAQILDAVASKPGVSAERIAEVRAEIAPLLPN